MREVYNHCLATVSLWQLLTFRIRLKPARVGSNAVAAPRGRNLRTGTAILNLIFEVVSNVKGVFIDRTSCDRESYFCMRIESAD
jgi:hypothetical protein